MNTDNEITAMALFESGELFSSSTFIDEETMTLGYGTLDSLGCWQYELPINYRIEHNICGGCITWSEYFEYVDKETRKKKLERILDDE